MQHHFNPPRILRHFFKGITWLVPHAPQTLYLTFDDGPIEGVTDYVLDQLATYGARATFFCLGRNAERYPELLERIRKEGHTVGNHTYSHLRGYCMSTESYYADVQLADSLLHAKLFRPPYARFTLNQYRALQPEYRFVLWSVLSMDYSRWISPAGCADIVLRNLRGGDILVFHDSWKAFENMRYALPRCLEYFTALGYQFAALDEALLAPNYLQPVASTDGTTWHPEYSLSATRT